MVVVTRMTRWSCASAGIGGATIATSKPITGSARRNRTCMPTLASHVGGESRECPETRGNGALTQMRRPAHPARGGRRALILGPTGAGCGRLKGQHLPRSRPLSHVLGTTPHRAYGVQADAVRDAAPQVSPHPPVPQAEGNARQQRSHFEL